MAHTDIAGLVAALEAHDIRPTGNRLLVARALSGAGRPLCLADLEALLDTVDKSNIFRTLTLFRDRHLVHTIEDESGSLHYEICASHSEQDDDDLHVHFYCRNCHQMTCLTALSIPPIELPSGYEADAMTYVVKGICPHCRARL